MTKLCGSTMDPTSSRYFRKFVFCTISAAVAGAIWFSFDGKSARTVVLQVPLHDGVSRRKVTVRKGTRNFEILPTLVAVSHKNIHYPHSTKAVKNTSSDGSLENKSLKTSLLNRLASELKHELERLSLPTSHGLSLYCGGRGWRCGLGDQLQHRAACLMLSYAWGIPLIHDPVTGWVNELSWEKVFKPFGCSNCRVNGDTIMVTWFPRQRPSLAFPNQTNVVYPFKNGIPVNRTFYELLKKVHVQPFLWFVGQFLKHIFRLSDELQAGYESWTKTLDLSFKKPLICFHVRRTDKLIQTGRRSRNISDFVSAAELYLKKMKIRTLPHYVYIASEVHTVLDEASKRYTSEEWRFIGNGNNVTFKDATERRAAQALTSAVKDIMVLSSECQLVLCSFTSDFCTVVYELMAANQNQHRSGIKSFENKYNFRLDGHWLPNRLIRVNYAKVPPNIPIQVVQN